MSYLFCAWVRFRVFLVGFWKFCQDDDVAVSQQELNGLREGYAEHSEAWLRERLREQSFPQMHGLAGAAGLPQHAGRRKLPKEELEPALWRSIAEQEASEGMDVRDDDAEGGYVALCNPLGKRRRPLDRRLAALGSRAWRERLRSVRLRVDDGLCLQQLAEELGVAFEDVRKETLIHRMVVVLCGSEREHRRKVPDLAIPSGSS